METHVEQQEGAEPIPSQILDLMLDVTLEVMQAKRGSIMVLDDEGQDLTIKASRGIKDEIIQEARVRLGSGISGKVAASGQPTTLIGQTGDSRLNIHSDDMVSPDVEVSFVAPIKLHDGRLGTVNIDSTHLGPETRSEKERQVQEILRRFSEYLVQAETTPSIQQEPSQLYMMNIFREYSVLRELRTVFDYVFYLITDLMDTHRKGILILRNPESSFFDLVLGYGIDRDRYREVYEKLIPQLREPKVDTADELTIFDKNELFSVPISFLSEDIYILVPLVWQGVKRGQILLFADEAPKLDPHTKEITRRACGAAARTIDESASDRKLQDFKFTDSLTGTYNYGLWWKRLHEEFSRARRMENPRISLIVFDIDQFDKFNRAHGFLIGDQLLRLIADRIKACLRNIDMIGRIGGDEFGVALPDTEKAGAEVVADRIQEALGNLPEEMRLELASSFSMSGGISAFPDDADTPGKLVERAKTALVSAKIMGGGRIKLFTSIEE